MQENLVVTSIIEKIRSSFEQQFTGLYKITSHKDAHWYVYFLLGRITWAQPSKRSFRAWRRHIDIHSPVLSKQIGDPVSLYYEYWNYAALSRLVKAKQFPRTQFSKIVEGYVADVLFDILQANEWQYDEFGDLKIETQKKEAGSMPFLMLENLHAYQKAEQSWQQWKQAGLSKISPGWAPTIKNADSLKEQTPLQTFQTLSGFANGETTLRDLAIKVKQPIIPIARSIRPYVSKQLLEFTEISDVVENAHHGFSLELTEVHQLTKQSDAEPTEESLSDSKSKESKSISQEPEKSVKVIQDSDSSVSVDNLTTEVAFINQELPIVKEASEKFKEENPTEENTELKRSSEEDHKEQNVAKEENAKKSSTTDESLYKNTESRTSGSEDTVGKSINQPAPPPPPPPVQKIERSQTAIKSVQGNQPKAERTQTVQNKGRKKRSRRSNLPKIVYVDDSPADSRTMGAIVEKIGYQYINIPDPLQAIPMLIELRPKLIFLDLVMPIANGYEVCAQIRRVTAFKKTPIIIVTSNDGIADRVRAKLVGASGFIGKPIKEKRVLKVFRKHLSYVPSTAPE